MNRNKVTRWPIGLGMNHLEQEAAASHFWNDLIDGELEPTAWLPVSMAHKDLFAKNMETGANMLDSGFIEMSENGEMVRLTDRAIELLEKFTKSGKHAEEEV